MANAVVQANLMALRAKGLLVAFLGTRFTLGNHFQIFAQFACQTRYLLLGVRALAEDSRCIYELISTFALWEQDVVDCFLCLDAEPGL